MKRSTVLIAGLVLTLALAAGSIGRLYAESSENDPAANQEQASNGPSAQQSMKMSEHGLAAMNDIQMARMAVNDGFVDNARKLLAEAKTLLGQVEQEDTPVTMTTEIKVGDKPVKQETVTEQPNLIPILTRMQMIEGYAAAVAERDAANTDQAKAAQSGQDPADGSAEAEATKTEPSSAARTAAVEQAKAQIRSGDHAGAVETLRLVDLGLVSQVVNMPLAETSAHVDKALALLEKDQFHQANLELKQATDGLVVRTQIVVEPVPAAGAEDAKVKSEQAG
ncbi:MAG: YfdX family protein [Thiohalocapsa sp. PB-PSB1]|nr:MAG: YfdX family protein [Thiohalocapsa sp. PB-PSB1]